MYKDNMKNKIIMINSFKGGAGKTSVALSYCMHNYNFNEDNYDNIFFIDIDILGTSLSYILFEDNRQLNYLSDYDEKKGVESAVNLVLQNEQVSFYAAILNPVSRQKNDYYGKNRLRDNREVMESIFQKRICEYINKMIATNKSNLFVIDCSPGFSNLELTLLSEFYGLAGKHNGTIEEVYVTTFDASHIRKTIDSLNGYLDFLHRDHRKVRVVLNDVNNCKGLSTTASNEGIEAGNDFVLKIEDVAEYIRENLESQDYLISYKEYSELILRSNIIKNEKKLINNIGGYVFPPSYFNEL